MSRAFVKESDEVPELPDRPVSTHPNFVTQRGLALIDAEIARFRAALSEAQAKQDRAEIAAASRELRYWNARRMSAALQPSPPDSEIVRFGSRVTIAREAKGRAAGRQTFAIVGEDEADPSSGTLSYVSPLARALLGKEVGDVVEVGPSEAKIVKIEIPRER
jgi:transcription elongation GreA/GreB family factor